MGQFHDKEGRLMKESASLQGLTKRDDLQKHLQAGITMFLAQASTDTPPSRSKKTTLFHTNLLQFSVVSQTSQGGERHALFHNNARLRRVPYKFTFSVRT